MEITIYAKKRTTREGRKFFSYLATLTRKDGTEQVVSVKFRDECGSPKPEECPANIIVEKGAANLSSRTFVREDTGEKDKSYTLWVNAWEMGEPFEDHSLDDFE